MAPTYPQFELDRQLCFALHRASRAVVRAYGPLLDGTGITYPQYLVLLVLWDDPDRSLPVVDIGRRLHLDTGTLTPLLKRLEALGYVSRARDAVDERRVLVSVTPEGLDLRDRLAQVPATLYGGLGLEPEAAISLHRDLVQLTERLEAAEGGARRTDPARQGGSGS